MSRRRLEESVNRMLRWASVSSPSVAHSELKETRSWEGYKGYFVGFSYQYVEFLEFFFLPGRCLGGMCDATY